MCDSLNSCCDLVKSTHLILYSLYILYRLHVYIIQWVDLVKKNEFYRILARLSRSILVSALLKLFNHSKAMKYYASDASLKYLQDAWCPQNLIRLTMLYTPKFEFQMKPRCVRSTSLLCGLALEWHRGLGVVQYSRHHRGGGILRYW